MSIFPRFSSHLLHTNILFSSSENHTWFFVFLGKSHWVNLTHSPAFTHEKLWIGNCFIPANVGLNPIMARLFHTPNIIFLFGETFHCEKCLNSFAIFRDLAANTFHRTLLGIRTEIFIHSSLFLLRFPTVHLYLWAIWPFGGIQNGRRS